MKWMRLTGFVLALTLLQAGMVGAIAITTIKPDLLLIALVFFAVYCNSSEVIICSFILGFAADIIGPAMGPQIISFCLFGTLLGNLHRIIAIRKMSYQALAIAIVGLSTGVLALFMAYIKGQETTIEMFSILLGTSLYSAIIGPFLFLPFAWLMRIKTQRFSQN